MKIIRSWNYDGGETPIPLGKFYQVDAPRFDQAFPGFEPKIWKRHDREVKIRACWKNSFSLGFRRRSEGMDKYVCTVCGYVYDPDKGDATQASLPGTAFENLPGDWVCPECGVGKICSRK